tara:strand:+ start:874 stop:1314 length:441 start_codon:yes stop_codon:yes gene_type:complete
MSTPEPMTPIERFEVALSLQLGIPMSVLKDTLTLREYELYQEYFITFGIGQEAHYIRSATEIITMVTQIAGAMGSKDKINLTPEEIYPQLSYDDPKKKKNRGGNSAVDWDNTPDHLKKQLIETGLFDKDGNPSGAHSNPIDQLRTQ